MGIMEIGIIKTVSELMIQDPISGVIVIVVILLVTFRQDIMGLIKGKKKNEADIHSIYAKTDLDRFLAAEQSRNNQADQLYKDLENMKAGFAKDREEMKANFAQEREHYLSEIKALKEQLQKLTEKVEKLQNTINENSSDKAKLESALMLKNHENGLLRNWLNSAMLKICERCKKLLGPIPEPMNERREFEYHKNV